MIPLWQTAVEDVARGAIASGNRMLAGIGQVLLARMPALPVAKEALGRVWWCAMAASAEAADPERSHVLLRVAGDAQTAVDLMTIETAARAA